MQLEQAESSEEQVDLFNYLAETYKEIDPNEAIEISYRALKIAGKVDYQEGIFYAYNNLATAYEHIGKGDSSLLYLNQALPLGVELDDEYALSVINNNFGLYYLFRGNYPLGLKYFQKSLEGMDDPGYFLDPIVIYNNIGVIHEEQGNYEKAITYYEKVVEYAENAGDVPYANLSLGYLAYLKEDYEEALIYYGNALVQYRESGDQLLTAESLFYIGEVYVWQGDLKKAKEVLLESLAIYNKLGLLYDELDIKIMIADIYMQEGESDLAMNLYHETAAFAKASKLNTILIPIYKALAEQYALDKDYQNAYDYQLQYQELNDTIYNNKTKERIAQLETTYELEVSKAKQGRLEAEQAEKDATVIRRTVIAIASTLVTILVAIIAIVFYRANQQKKILNKNLESKVRERTAELENVNSQLVETNEELERFTYIASHDMKEPIRNINSFINLIQRRLGTQEDSDIQEYMGYVTKNTRQMYTLVDDVLAFSRIAALDLKNLAWLDLNLEMLDLRETLKTQLQEKNATLETTGMPSVRAEKSHIFMVFKNLIENALKYNESEPPILKVRYTSTDAFFCFYVEDNGIGIAPEYHHQIFEMFKRMNARDKYEGTGIGLAICKKIVNKYGGTIGVESEVGAGSRFYFTWPR